MSIQHSKKSAEWWTPPEILDAVREVLGPNFTDPACSSQAHACVHKSKRVRYISEGGLRNTDWGKSVFLNPPSPPRDWWCALEKGFTERKIEDAIYLAYSIEQLQQSQLWEEKGLCYFSMLEYDICIPKRRIAFLEPPGVVKKSPAHANAIVYLGESRECFVQAFHSIGGFLFP